MTASIARPHVPPDESGARSHTQATILLVDDDRITRRGMAARLKRSGYCVLEADNGQAALAAVRTHRPDLTILDWMMPGLDGPTVCERIRADPELRSSHVILMTALDQPEEISEGLARGADDFLSKSASRQEILARVHASLRANALVRELEVTRDGLHRSNDLLRIKQEELEQELKSAAQFIESVLPDQAAVPPDLAMAWSYYPSLALGGDLFQVRRWGPSAIGVFILDASGHGISAALRAMSLMSFLHEDNIARVVDSFDPGQILMRANQRFPLGPDGDHYTLWVGRLDLDANSLAFSSAGHGGALLGRGGESVTWLTMPSSPLGFDPDARFITHTVRLQNHDRLFLCSDGLYEVPSKTGEPWGKSRLQQTIEQCHSLPLTESVMQTVSASWSWHDSDHFPDDVALLGLELRQTDSHID